ncbi:hypothetical protein FRC03_003923 [Tulasnella sp. 419]|nr:hypothetical protein FRC02_001100 [Tulasnella sp. 418]KAG8962670.1 hypothetical protein FRC03_003923 [Tulasnella sp. 419]
MVNYNDPAVLMDHAQIFNKILLVIQGYFTWEVILTGWFDWQVIRGKRKFKWPMVVYWIAKYSMFAATIGLAVANNYTGSLHCQSLYTFNQFVGNTAIGGASSLLMLRTIAIWSENWHVIGPLVFLSLGQWGILMHGVTTVKAQWNEAANQCVINSTQPVFLRLIYIYTMSFDFVILVVTVVGLIKTRSRRTGLWALLFADGVIYFLVAFTVNLGATFMLLLNLNPILNVILAVPAAALSCTVACRSFIRLSTFTPKDVYVHSSQAISTTKFASGWTGRKPKNSKVNTLTTIGSGLRSETFAVGGHGEDGVSRGDIHELQMETYSHRDESHLSLGGTEEGSKIDVSRDDSEHGHDAAYRRERKRNQI